MKLSEILAQSYSWNKSLPLPTADRLGRAVEAVQERYGVAKPAADAMELEEKLLEFEERLERDDWSGFPWHRASDLFRSLFTSDRLDDPRWSDIAAVLLDTLEDKDRKNYCRAALEIYIETFGKVGGNLERLRDILASKRADEIPVRRALIEDLSIFDPDAAPNLIGRELAAHERPYEFLKSLGIWSPHATGLFERAFDVMLSEIEPDLTDLDRSAYERVMNWLHPNSTTKAEATRAAGIGALVLPFEDKEGSELRDDVERFLIGAFGDPRVQNAQWAGVSQVALNIVYRWMTSKSLKIFFDIIDQFEGSHMWKPRRAFWTQMDDRKWIDDAWVVLNHKGAKIAGELERRHEDKAFLSHGKLDFYEQEKCFFIMKVGRLTIVEGTHNFKVRIFDADAKAAPSLRGRSYNKKRIYSTPSSGEGEAHQHDPHDNWMRKTEDYMRRNR